MDEKMREKIARALCEEAGRDPDQLEPGNAYGVDAMQNGEEHFYLWRMYTETADAVLDVMREPTEQMIVAGIIERHDSETPEAWKLATANIFTAMIDAAKNGA